MTRIAIRMTAEAAGDVLDMLAHEVLGFTGGIDEMLADLQTEAEEILGFGGTEIEREAARVWSRLTADEKRAEAARQVALWEEADQLVAAAEADKR